MILGCRSSERPPTAHESLTPGRNGTGPGETDAPLRCRIDRSCSLVWPGRGIARDRPGRASHTAPVTAYDLVIVGGGAAGSEAAFAAAHGSRHRILLAEARHFGGTCTNHGCVPTKALVRSAKIA
ncbi:MAG: FAD-dependent oxidoreductase, partial [Chloroflexi bacterium]